MQWPSHTRLTKMAALSPFDYLRFLGCQRSSCRGQPCAWQWCWRTAWRQRRRRSGQARRWHAPHNPWGNTRPGLGWSRWQTGGLRTRSKVWLTHCILNQYTHFFALIYFYNTVDSCIMNTDTQSHNTVISLVPNIKMSLYFNVLATLI